MKSLLFGNPGIRLLLASAIILCSGLNTSQVFATSEMDPFAGPLDQGKMDASITAGDVVSTTNTIRFPAISSRAQREPAAGTISSPSGILSGRIIYTSPGHGWQYSSAVGRWATDRGITNSMTEDMGNQDQFTFYCNYLFNAGATVVPMRPIGNQVNEIILDNDDSARVTFSGPWSASTGSQYYGQASDSVSYMFTGKSATETAVATYRPNIIQPGFYPIYTWVLNSSNRIPNQLYRIVHSGGVSEVRINHIRVGRGWVYLGTYYLPAGTGSYVEISNQSNSATGTNIIADAIRFGNGIGDISVGGSVSGFPREDEASMYWLQRSNGIGGSSSVYANGNVGAPPRAAVYMNNENDGAMTDRLYIGIHSNSASGTARGAIGLINNGSQSSHTPTPNQTGLATIFGKELNEDLRALGTNGLPVAWSSRTTYNLAGLFGEITNATLGGEMDATIVEVAFHDNADDAAVMKDTNGRKFIARAMLHATIKYFSQYGGLGTAVFPPNPPVSPKVVSQGNGTALVSWSPAPADPTGSGNATSYLVYSSSDGYGFGNPVTVTGSTQTAVLLVAGETKFLRISARNSAGESFPTETLAVRSDSVGANSILIVNAFDRLDAAMNPREVSVNGTVQRVKPWKSNNFDYVVPHAKALASSGYSFDSVSNEGLSEALLGNYRNLIWIAGEESTNDKTFSSAEQGLVQSFLQSDNKSLFVSGAEIGWDLQQAGGGISFYNNYLMTNYVSDDAGTYNILAGSGIFSTVPAFSYGPAAPVTNTTYPPAGYAFYDADYADTISPVNGSMKVLSYSTNAGAAVAGSLSGSSSKIISFAFPFECIREESARNLLMQNSAAYFNYDSSGVTDWSVY